MDVNTKLVECALQMVGRPYKWGGTTPLGFDCTGLVSYCYQFAGIPLVHHHAEELLAYCEGGMQHYPARGLLAFRRQYSLSFDTIVVDHVGILVNPREVVSSRRGRGVVKESLKGSDYGIVTKLRDNYVPPKCVDITKESLEKFTSCPDFVLKLDDLLRDIKDVIAWECEVHADTASKGLIPWLVNCERKGSRLLNRVKGYPGRDSMKHDLRDGLRYFIYANLYYDMLKEGESGN